MGSLGTDTNISDITYKKVYTWSSNQMYMIKSNGGNGTASNVVLETFIGHGNAYSLDIDQYWSSMSPIAGDGVQLNNIKIMNWTGTEADGAQRGPVKINCADGAPCTGVDLIDFAMWTETGDEQWYSCRSAYTNIRRSPPLFCLNGGSDHVSYSATTTTVTAAPTGYQAPTMAADLLSVPWVWRFLPALHGLRYALTVLTNTLQGTTAEIPIPTMPASFFPDTTPISALAG